MNAPIDVSQFPPADRIVGQYIMLRDHVKQRTKEFEETGALSDSDVEAIDQARQWSAALRSGTYIGAGAEDADLLDYLIERVERLSMPMKAYKDGMEALEGAANLLIEATGQKALSTTEGTAFRKSVLSVTMGDRDEFIPWVISTNGWNFITNHISKEAVETWLERPGEDGKPLNKPPPGVKVEWISKVQFRQA